MYASDVNDLLQARVAMNVRLARTNAGLSQRRLADLLDTGKISISRWENGHVMPSTANVIAMADLFGLDPVWFYADHSAEAAAAA
jgi:transcriptional regulator with XRE-family HTH domain